MPIYGFSKWAANPENKRNYQSPWKSQQTLLELSPTEVGITGKYELGRNWEWIKFPSGQKD